MDRAASAAEPAPRPAPSRRFTAYVVPHTHWDREWYQPFQVFRARLVEVIDRVLEILRTDPDVPRFTLDGQAVVLEDYLEVRPERREEIRRLVQAGRLRIGPWYVLADEFLVSPEALVRNLMLGQRVCQDFGEAMPVAYTPDSFGHISQLPLIVRGFGLDSIVFERGVGDEGERLRGEFCWLAADGKTAVFAVHLLGTYSAAAGVGHADWQLGDAYDPSRAAEQVRAALYGLREGELSDMPSWLRESFERVKGGMSSYATGQALILLNGSDHLFPQANLPQIVADLNRALPEVEFVQGDVEDFVEAARRPLESLEPYQGEFRGSRYQHVLSGVLSARIYLKQANHHAETLLERYVEPLAAWAKLSGAPYPDALLREAWRLLLQNHPHDSICGCSVDAVHRDMLTRFAGVEQLGRHLIDRSFGHLAGAPGKESIAVFNPVPLAKQAVVEAAFELPHGQGANLGVVDADGRALPCQLELSEAFAPGRSDLWVDLVRLRFVAPLPPLGVASFGLTADGPAEVTTDLRATERTLENDALRLEATREGELTLTDKRSGHVYPLALHFEDLGDAGDEYDFSPVTGDTPLRLAELRQPPALVEAGPVRATLRLDYAAEIPAGLSEDRARREGLVAMPLALDISLGAGSSLLRLRVRLTNRARDHRLRLRVATGVRTDKVLADGHFDVLERPLVPPTGEGWFQKPQPTSHQRAFVLASGGGRGLALLNAGLPEYEAIETPGGVDLAVTLLRSVGWLSRNDLASRPQGAGPALPTPEAQCLGEHVFDLALHPFSGEWWRSELLAEVQSFVTPPICYPAAETGTAHDWLELSAPLRLSAFKRAEDRDGLVVRVWNPAPVDVAGSLALGRPPRAAYDLSLAERREGRLKTEGTTIRLTLEPKAVRTIELLFEENTFEEDEEDAS